MTRVIVIGCVALMSVATILLAGRIPISYVSSGDYNSHTMNYRPECEQVLKRYIPNEHKQHMTYYQGLAMAEALNACNAHATPGMTKQWAMAPMK